ncbi:hypothetical protein [Nocardia pseudobrasiliensis]|uniref:Uncharacterized protein n=1 Tax=Nocardia pseudobrasiliensis TaxID=45979 RepID=A0A370HLI8_9NOCA|nr:hypothetical protein [Nocardia pseudobrasiliensis]RDI59035.1 hypothetical protein DFR76_12038 [Nocardia pseudobrasiliensis]
MSTTSTRRWIDAAKRVGNGELEGIRCPENGDDFLEVTWIPGPGDTGEYRLRCPTCGAENFLRTTRAPGRNSN